MLTKQIAQETLIKCAGNKTKAAKLLKVSRSALRWALTGNKKTTTVPSATVITKGKTLDDFKKTYDKDYIVPNKIKEGLKVLGKSGWEYESVFAKNCGVSISDISNYRDLFSDFIVPLKKDGKRVWAGTKQFAQQLREMV